MTSSVVLSTYNGARYLLEQLDSLRNQSRTIDEVLISDDCSTDETVELVESYINDHGLDGWILSVNMQNKGWRRNFHDLLLAASGDYVFLCDQDDIWLSDKIAEMLSVMEAHSEIDVLACDVEPFYEARSQKITRMQGQPATKLVEFTEVDKRAVYVQRPGCSYCIRKSFIEQVEPYWDVNWPHDAVLWMLSEVKGSLALYRKPFVRFRRHEGNASARQRLTRESRIADVEELIERIDVMKRFGSDFGFLTSQKKAVLDDYRVWLDARRTFLKARDISQLRIVLQGRSRFVTLKGMMVDFALAILRNASL